ncbi:hypothetical protein ACHAWF_015891 [Thalassiosira exigua]
MIVHAGAAARSARAAARRRAPSLLVVRGAAAVAVAPPPRSVAGQRRPELLLGRRRRPSPPLGPAPASSLLSGSAPFSSAAAEEAVDDDDDDDDDVPPASAHVVRRRGGVRNVAIVAHVDHGKTTLVDELLRVARASSPSSSDDTTADDATNAAAAAGQAGEGAGKGSEGERLLDSGELERERGITITSKVTRLDYASSDGEPHVINVVDTPGHADFAGEVDRILSTVDGVVLVVDAGEGPKSQTKYVLSRALNLGLVPIVVLNKADRPEGVLRLEGGETELELMDLFENLDATDEQMEYRTMFGSARSGWITEDADAAVAIAHDGGGADSEGARCMRGLLDAMLADIPAPSVHWYGARAGEDREKAVEEFAEEPFSMTANTVGYDPYLGRTCTGRIYSGKVRPGDSIALLRRRDGAAESAGGGAGGPRSEVSGVFANRGVSRVALDPPVAYAGDIVTLTGVPESMKVGDTVTATENSVPRAVDTPPLAPPTLSCLFGANNGPMGGREGTIVASSQVRARLVDETDNNVTLNVELCEDDAEKTVVLGRGELQIGILVEQMRREGYEMIITPPMILTTVCPETGVKLEPYEEVVVDVDAEYSGTVVNALTGSRKGVLVEMMDDAGGKTRMRFEIPSRGLLGFGPEVASATRGTAVMHHCYLEDREYAGTIAPGSDRGKLVSNESGKATLYALETLQSRGTLFVAPGDVVYPGMVVGENSKQGDLEVNPVKAKATNNMRTTLKDEKLNLAPPRRLSVEELIGYMAEDEVIEVTPLSVRLRKAELDAGVRERAARARKKQIQALRQQQGGGKKK